MNPRLLELGLKKQRLQMQAATQRLQMAQHLQGFAPVFAVADKVGAVVHWLGKHPQWLVGAAVVLLVARPRAAFRWLWRGFFVWRALRRTREALQSLVPTR